MQANGVGGTVPLLADDQLGEALEWCSVGETARLAAFVRRAFVILGAEEEHHHVGVLLNRAGFAKVGKLRPAVFARTLFRSARKLRQRHNWYAQLPREGLQ